MKISRPNTRGSAAYIGKRAGAYLIVLHESSERDGTTVPDDLFTCASSLVKAKRIARAGAEELEWAGPFRWEERDGGWWLMATDNDAYEYDDEGDEED